MTESSVVNNTALLPVHPTLTTIFMSITKRKAARINFEKISKIGHTMGLRFVRIPIEQSSSTMSSVMLEHPDTLFHFHKISDLLSPNTPSSIADFVSILKKHFPKQRIFDPLPSIISLCNRLNTITIISSVSRDFSSIQIPQSRLFSDVLTLSTCSPKSTIDDPIFNELDSLFFPFSFPVIIKPILASGHPMSHKLGISWNLKDLLQWKETHLPKHQCMIQQIIPNSRLIKVYYLFGEFHLQERHQPVTSVKKQSLFTFNSQDSCNSINPGSISSQVVSIMKKFTKSLADTLGIHMFGVDILLPIVDSEQNQNKNDSKTPIYIIDVNYFPSFQNFPEFHQKLCSAILEKVQG